MHLPPEEWTATVKSNDDMQSSVGVGRLASGLMALRLSWWNENWGKSIEGLVIDGHFNEEHHFDLRLRKPDEVVSPWLTKELHRLLLEVLNDGKHAGALPEMCDNLENFGELEILGQIAKKNQAFGRDVAEILTHDADIIKGFRAGLLIKEGKRPDNSNWPYEYSVLCRWRGFDHDPQLTKDITPILHEQLQLIINDLLITAEPLWPKQGPVVFSQLEKLAKPTVPRLLRAMEVSDERLNSNFWGALKRSNPDVNQVLPFFKSDNSFVAVAAIAAVLDKLTAEDAKTALEKLLSISNPGISRIPPDPTFTKDPLFTHQLNAIWLQGRLDELIPQVNARIKSSE
jgi:hypothetical protein